MSTPSSSHTCVAYKLGGWPRTACTPAEATSMSFRLPRIRRKRPSAMGLRQMLPVQTKRTLFTMDARASVRKINLESNKAKSTRSWRARKKVDRPLRGRCSNNAASPPNLASSRDCSIHLPSRPGGLVTNRTPSESRSACLECAVRSSWKKIRYRLEWLGLRLATKLVPLLSRKTCFHLAQFLGAAMSILDRPRRKVALSNIEVAFGDQLSIG